MRPVPRSPDPRCRTRRRTSYHRLCLRCQHLQSAARMESGKRLQACSRPSLIISTWYLVHTTPMVLERQRLWPEPRCQLVADVGVIGGLNAITSPSVHKSQSFSVIFVNVAAARYRSSQLFLDSRPAPAWQSNIGSERELQVFPTAWQTCQKRPLT